MKRNIPLDARPCSDAPRVREVPSRWSDDRFAIGAMALFDTLKFPASSYSNIKTKVQRLNDLHGKQWVCKKVKGEDFCTVTRI